MDSLTILSIVIPIILILAFLIIRTLRVIPEYQRGISFRFGHLRSELKPGINMVIPLIDSLQRVDMRVITLTIPPQEVITKDNVPARVNAVVLFRGRRERCCAEGGELPDCHLADCSDYAAFAAGPRGP